MKRDIHFPSYLKSFMNPPASFPWLAQCAQKGFLLALLATFAGCAALPNVGPFVDASNQLRSAVATSGATVEAELRLLPEGGPQADQLKQAWAARNAAFAGMAAYSSSIKGIVDAGNSGAASAQKVADSIGHLAQAAGIALPGSPEAISTVTDIAKFVSSQIALIRAAKSLNEAMTAAQPAVESISQLIAADLKDLEALFVAAARKSDNAIRTGDEFSELLGYRAQILKQIRQGDPSKADLLAQQNQLNQLLQGTEVWYAEYTTRRKAVDDRLRAGRALIQAATQSANDWAMTHGQLLLALKDRRPVNTQSLLQAADEIQTLVRKVRAL